MRSEALVHPVADDGLQPDSEGTTYGKIGENNREYKRGTKIRNEAQKKIFQASDK